MQDPRGICQSGQIHTVHKGNRCGSLYHSPDHPALCPVLHCRLCQDSGFGTKSTRNLIPRIACGPFCQRRSAPHATMPAQGRTGEVLDAEWLSRKFLSGVGMAARPWRCASALGRRTIAKSQVQDGLWRVATGHALEWMMPLEEWSRGQAGCKLDTMQKSRRVPMLSSDFLRLPGLLACSLTAGPASRYNGLLWTKTHNRGSRTGNAHSDRPDPRLAL